MRQILLLDTYDSDKKSSKTMAIGDGGLIHVGKSMAVKRVKSCISKFY